jgi:hypothetical protein
MYRNEEEGDEDGEKDDQKHASNKLVIPEELKQGK